MWGYDDDSDDGNNNKQQQLNICWVLLCVRHCAGMCMSSLDTPAPSGMGIICVILQMRKQAQRGFRTCPQCRLAVGSQDMRPGSLTLGLVLLCSTA